MDDEKDEICPDCGGTGEVNEDIYDEDSHQWQPVGVKKCHCQLENEE